MSAAKPPEVGDGLRDLIWTAPLVPAAFVFTGGVVLDRFALVPLLVSLLALALSLFAWVAASVGHRRGLSLVYLALAGIAFGAVWHRYRCDSPASDDVGFLAPAEPRPAVVRGVVTDEPFGAHSRKGDPLRSIDPMETTRFTLRVTAVRQGPDWLPTSGSARVIYLGRLSSVYAGDAVELAGRLSQPRGPSNPGEFDHADHLRGQGIRAEVVVRSGEGDVRRLAPASLWSPVAWLTAVRGWGQQALQDSLAPSVAGVGIALLLGDGGPMSADDWDRYVRTGVVHVLAISGQHLVLLGAFLWGVLRMAGVRQREGAVAVALMLTAYALVTGGRPSAMRAAAIVCAVCLGLLLRRRSPPANGFALAWLTIALLNPADLFTAGCQLSFLATAVLYWRHRIWTPAEPDPLDALVEESLAPWQQWLRWMFRVLGEMFVVSLVIWLLVTPLAAARSNVVAPVAIVLGLPLILLTAVALPAGFLLLLIHAVAPPLAVPLAWVVDGCLWACEALVRLADHGHGYVYVPAAPVWWLAGLYTLTLGLLVAASRGRRRWVVVAIVGWLSVGLIGGASRLPSGELRCTVLAVGHGGCCVIETPDARTLLYDAGAIAGPDVTRRVIAPYLWSRGVRHIDEVFLSHADLDHYNGLVDLQRRFSIGVVSLTPSFADKPYPGVREVLASLDRGGIPRRELRAGDVLTAGDARIDVLHPPPRGPDGPENVRSLVLRVRYAGQSVLLTGDLEGEGLGRILDLTPEPIDVLMAPHHGSAKSDPGGLAAWCRPRIVVSSQGPPRGAGDPLSAYERAGARVLRTDRVGAVTIRIGPNGLVVETFRGDGRWTIGM